MNELISLTQSAINGELQQTVNARELHAFLEVRTRFNDWIASRINEYDFVENQDFVIFTENSVKIQKGRPSNEYQISLDMAKELAMVERNEKANKRDNTSLSVKSSLNRRKAVSSLNSCKCKRLPY